MATLIELPSGLILNLDLVESIRPRNPTNESDTNLAYVGGTDADGDDGAYEITDDDLAYLKRVYVARYDPNHK